LHVVGLIDWQHTSILPLFLLTCVPQDVIGHELEGRVPVEYYEEAMSCSRKMKEDVLTSESIKSEEERLQIAAHWPFDDTDKEEYM